MTAPESESESETEASTLAEELADDLEEGVEFVADGQFSVDVEQAGAKLERFQLVEAAVWVLLALEAGLACGPRQVLVAGPLDGIDLTFEGVELSDDELDETKAVSVGAKFGSASRRQALQLLGYATRAAAHAHGHATLQSTSRGLYLSVRGSPCKRERELIRDRCWAVSVPVLVEFRPVSSGPRAGLDRSRGVVPFTHGGREVGVAGYAKSREVRGMLSLTRHGVVYEQLRLPASLAKAHVVLDLPLPRDLSLTKFLRQAEFEALAAGLDAFGAEFEDHARRAREAAPAPAPRPEASEAEADPNAAIRAEQIETLFDLLFRP